MKISILDKKNQAKICIIGLGYVGLPLAGLFATKFLVLGYDINEARVKELRRGKDSNLEISKQDLESVMVKSKDMDKGLYLTSTYSDIDDADIYIITVPTPINKNNNPDISLLRKATELVAKKLSPGNVVIYESTVYPGLTEDICVPILAKHSRLQFNNDFFVGYTPERINAGDKEHALGKVTKVISGSTIEVVDMIKRLYKKVGITNIYLAPSIKVAEAAKVIENAQRDLNIAFVNEVSIICDLLNIKSSEVLRAANTKWNFLDFKPGLVGGHCIPVDPYYLASIAEMNDYHPEIILAGRRINENMAQYWVSQLIKRMIDLKLKIKGASILVLGISFKANCPDIRNSKSAKLIKILTDLGFKVTIYDPWAEPQEVMNMYKMKSSKKLKKFKFDVVMPTVAHREYTNLNVAQFKNSLIYDPREILKG